MYLNQRDIPTQTHPPPIPEDHVVRLDHLSKMLRITNIEPTLRSETRRVRAV
jgi:hypothetical protein